MSHTKTPLRVYGGKTDGYGIVDANGKSIYNPNNGHPFQIFYDDTEDYAAFIVRACNAHDELLEALKDCLSFLVMQGDFIPGEHSLQLLAINKARAALAKAKGE